MIYMNYKLCIVMRLSAWHLVMVITFYLDLSCESYTKVGFRSRLETLSMQLCFISDCDYATYMGIWQPVL